MIIDTTQDQQIRRSIQKSVENLSHEIYQELDNLSYLNDELFNYWCDQLFYPDDEDEMILEKCTPELLLELRQIVDDNR